MKPVRRTDSIKIKLLMATFFLVIGVNLAFTLFTYLNQKQIYLSHIDKILKIASESESLYLGNDFVDKYDRLHPISEDQYVLKVKLLSEYAQKNGLEYIYLLVKEGSKVYIVISSATPDELKKNKYDRFYTEYNASQTIQNGFFEGNSFHEDTIDKYGNFRSYLQINKSNNGKLYFIGADISTIDIENNLQQLLQKCFVFFLISMIVAFFIETWLSNFISQRILQPLETLADASKAYIEGKEDTFVPIQSKNEIGRLSEIFNQMLQQQKNNEQELQQRANEVEKGLFQLREQKLALDSHAIVAITDTRGIITYANDKFCKISGYSRNELIGNDHRIINSGMKSKGYWKEMYQTINQGNTWHDEVCNRAKDGHLYWVDTTIFPFMDENGKPESYIAIRTDISARKKMEAKLQEALDIQKAIFDNAGVSIITTDINGIITTVNQTTESLMGYTQEELIGKTPALFHKPDEIMKHAAELSIELNEDIKPGLQVVTIKAERNLPNAHEWTFIRKNKEEIYVYLVVTALYRNDGSIYGFMGIASDISIIKEAERQSFAAKEAAEASDRAKSEFLAAMSHEIRTPMNGVLGMLELLIQSPLKKEQYSQVSIAQNSAKSLLSLINDILDFSKIEAGKMEIEFIEFNLLNELSEFIETIAYRAQDKWIEIILDTTQVERSFIISDPGRLRQILINLVGNAIKFTHSGEIVIKVAVTAQNESHGMLYLEVSDTGIGIAEEKIESLFEAFTQADGSTTRQYGGTGLGLAIVKNLCTLMSGTIQVSSKINKGSKFTVELPVEFGKQNSFLLPDISLEGKSILVVDDNKTNRAVLSAQLGQWGMVVYEAEDALVAYDQCKSKASQGIIPPYDIALLDMQMPYLDGEQLGRELRKMTECTKMKMVMMTSIGSRSDSKRFAEIGFNAFFTKPTNIKDLHNALRVLLNGDEHLQNAAPLVTKDFLGILKESTSEETIWPSNLYILLVEDNQVNQMVALGMLNTMGLTADVASNGIEALNTLKEGLKTTPYTLILMDCQMPEMDGYETSEAIRAQKAGKEYQNIPIIAMTANAMNGDRERCINAGMNDYISKPIDMTILKETILKWVNGISTCDDMDTFKGAVDAIAIEESKAVLDKDDALLRLGGKNDLLIRILTLYKKDALAIFDQLQLAIESGDTKNTRLYAHSLKGSSGNISALQVQHIATQIESAVKENNMAYLEKYALQLEEAIVELFSVIDTYLKEYDSPHRESEMLDTSTILEQLMYLKDQLQTGVYIDTDSVEIFHVCLKDEIESKISQLKYQIDQFNTPQALATASEMIDLLITQKE